MILNLEEVVIEPGQILVEGVREWRADCGAGQFKKRTVYAGNKLDMEIVAAKSKFCQPFPQYPPMDWLCLLFVDPEGVLSSVLLKKESLENFMELLRQLKRAGKSILGNLVRASMSQRAGKGKDSDGNTIAVTYFAVEFEMADKPAKYAPAIAELRNTVDCNQLLTFRETAVIESKSQVLAAVRASA